jgi:hypothetical protein
MYSEHGLEVEYSLNPVLIPFIRLAYLDRDYKETSWEGETVGRSTEKGFQVWIGDKIKPFTWGFTRNLEFPFYYRQSQIDFNHVGLAWGSGEGREKISTKAFGTGLSFNIDLGKWIIVEPFWYGDYGYYEIEKISGNTAPDSPYSYKWDDENRVGINVGFKF